MRVALAIGVELKNEARAAGASLAVTFKARLAVAAVGVFVDLKSRAKLFAKPGQDSARIVS